MVVPYVFERTSRGERGYDIFSRLLKSRIVLLGDEVDDNNANVIIAQLLFLEAEDPDKEINLYINSPGGLITAGLAIYDTMQHIKAPVNTICLGQAASMGAFLLAGGQKGGRMSLPNAQMMIHQPHGGARGQASDIEVAANEILRMRTRLNFLLSHHTGHPIEKIEADVERDYFMSPEEALAYGLIDKIVGQTPDELAQ
ncbi:MAG: ATP-dependent Clp endopeptidase proteolytic subunit ClpP [Candidatus Sericytochromatia bacterium]